MSWKEQASSSSSSIPLVVEQDLTVLLEEVHRHQSTVLESLQEENWRFEDAAATFDLEEEARQASCYIAKLRDIRRVMIETRRRLGRLQERSFKVRHTAEKLQEDAYKDWMEDVEYQRQLLAKYEPGMAGGTSKRKA
ncbi:hypothetical protein BV898_08024 [Hypsibius exemplaris]|nr:hypothetical protein BV898_08024 [Hypsibius exemplaris]